MTQAELHARIGQLEQMYRGTPAADRSKLQPEVQTIIRRLKEQRQPLPVALRRIEARLEQDAYDDMFENMPV